MAYQKRGSVLFFLALLTCTNASAGLIHSYYFDSDASDSTGSENGTLLGGASVSGGALQLDGLDDYVEFNTQMVPTSGSYSVALFASQTRPQSNFVELISQGFSTGPGFYIGHDPAQNIRVSDSWLSTGIAFPSNGEFHHIAVVVDASLNNTLLYVDGIEVAELSSAIATTSLGTNTRLGRQFSPFDEFFAGAIDELLIYDSAISADEVARLAQKVAVPEPPSWTLVAAGFLMTGLARRRRHQTLAQPSKVH